MPKFKRPNRLTRDNAKAYRDLLLRILATVNRQIDDIPDDLKPPMGQEDRNPYYDDLLHQRSEIYAELHAIKPWVDWRVESMATITRGPVPVGLVYVRDWEPDKRPAYVPGVALTFSTGGSDSTVVLTSKHQARELAARLFTALSLWPDDQPTYQTKANDVSPQRWETIEEWNERRGAES